MANKFQGYQSLKRFIRQARQAKKRGIKQIEIGFFETARYPPVSTGKNGGRPQTPHYVATVAAWNEFGTRNGIPARPFFSQAVEESKRDVKKIFRQHINAKTITPDDRVAKLAGEAVKGHIQEKIVDLREPPNAPRTIARKGSSNPLVDTGTMLNAVTYKIK